MKVICIDFETSHSYNACSVGLAALEHGTISPIGHWLIKPHEEHSYFHPVNISIHGITPEDVMTEPEFDVIYSKYIKPVLKGAVFAAHNAAFDMAVLRANLDLYGIEHPDIEYICSCKISRKAWDLPSHKLNLVSQYLNFDFTHHNALADAIACANILKRATEDKGFKSLEELLESIKIPYSSFHKLKKIKK